MKVPVFLKFSRRILAFWILVATGFTAQGAQWQDAAVAGGGGIAAVPATQNMHLYSMATLAMLANPRHSSAGLEKAAQAIINPATQNDMSTATAQQRLASVLRKPSF